MPPTPYAWRSQTVLLYSSAPPPILEVGQSVKPIAPSPLRDFFTTTGRCRDRNTARAVLSGELPIHAPFRFVQWVPNSTMSHVSVSPPFHPGRSDFPSPVGDLDLPNFSLLDLPSHIVT